MPLSAPTTSQVTITTFYWQKENVLGLNVTIGHIIRIHRAKVVPTWPSILCMCLGKTIQKNIQCQLLQNNQNSECLSVLYAFCDERTRTCKNFKPNASRETWASFSVPGIPFTHTHVGIQCQRTTHCTTR